MPRALSVIMGVVLGLGLAEGGLRLYFHEHESNRNYWGRGAFVDDEALIYRHAPCTTAWSGRYGVFGPHAITTDDRGFRNRRAQPSAASSMKIAMFGASIGFGVGVERDEDLLHAQLEEALRRTPGWPTDLEIYNFAQTGYLASQIATLALQEVERVEPDRVFVRLAERAVAEARSPPRTDSVGGYRLRSTRPFRGTWLDVARTRSRLYMRCTQSPALKWPPDLPRGFDRLTDAKRGSAPANSAENDSDAGQARTPLTELAPLWRRLETLGIPLVCLVITPPGEPEDVGFVAALRAQGVEVIVVPAQREWCYPNDNHWHAGGHRIAAEYIAERLAPPVGDDGTRGSAE